jgi:hypothetical protein
MSQSRRHLLSRVRRLVRGISTVVRGGESVPVVTVLSTDGKSWPTAGVDVDSTPGLVGVLAVGTGPGRVAICLWRSKAHAETQEDALRSSLGLPPGESVATQPVIAVATSKRGWWPQTTSGWIERAAAVWAAASVCAAAAGWLLARPDVVLRIPPTVDVLAGQEFVVSATATNRSRFAASLDVSSPTAGASVEPAVLALDGREVEKFELQARAGQTSQVFTVAAVARAGWLYPPRTSTHEIAVKVWPPLRYSRTPSVRGLDGNRPRFIVNVETGRAVSKGIDCQATTLGIRGFEFVGTGTASDFSVQVGGSRGKEVAVIRWRTPPVAAFESVDVNLLARGPSAGEWAVAAQNTTVRCEEARNGEFRP